MWAIFNDPIRAGASVNPVEFAVVIEHAGVSKKERRQGVSAREGIRL
jgi:hypothetical protein